MRFVALTLLGWSGGLLGAGPRLEIPPVFIAGELAGGHSSFTLRAPNITGVFEANRIDLDCQGVRVQIGFVGASPSLALEALETAGARYSSLVGADPRKWVHGAEAFSAIRYRDLYPGIDLVYREESARLKAEFRVSPHVRPSTIEIRYLGGATPAVDAAGRLTVRTPTGEFREAAPVVYQDSAGGRTPITASYVVSSGGTVGFHVGPYDATLPLIIDPTLQFSTFLGGPGLAAITGIAVDSGGNIYFAGWTDSTVAPVTGPIQSATHGSNEAFVGKFDSTGRLVFTTYLGGSGSDKPTGLAVDGTGSVVVTGWTTSSDFPTANALQRSRRGSRTAFVARLNPSGTQLTFSTLLGGSRDDVANGVAVDPAGNAYIVGQTNSSDFPVLAGVQMQIGGGYDAFLTKLGPTGTLLYSTYFGGSLDDGANAVAISSNGVAYLAGATQSTDLPVFRSAQAASGGGQDAFVASIDPSRTTLTFSTYLGGRAGSVGLPEFATGIAVDPAGDVYVTGVTASDNFPTTAGAVFGSPRGGIDGFVCKLSGQGNHIVYCTYMGGASVDLANAIAVDSAGRAYIAGATWSQDYPSMNPTEARSYDYDVFVTELDPTGSSIAFSTYLGGLAADNALSIALDASANVYIGGQSFSYDFPVLGSIDPFMGSSQGILVKIQMGGGPPIAGPLTPAFGSGASQTFSALFTNPGGAAAFTSAYMLINSAWAAPSSCYVSYQRSGNALYLLNDSALGWLGPVTPGNSSTLQNNQCTLNAAASSVTIAGNTLTLNAALTFTPAFSGNKTIFLFAYTSSADTGYKTSGTWTVTSAGPPTVGSLTPASGSGASQVFSASFTNPGGAAAFTNAYMLINSSWAAPASCYVSYQPSVNAFYLLNDSASGWLGPVAPGIAATLQNNQCTLDASASNGAIAGNTLTMNSALTFKPAFLGTKTVFLFAYTSSTSTSFATAGTWTVSAGPPTAGPLTPASGSGTSQTFSAPFTNPGGADAFTSAYIVINSSWSAPASCYVSYQRSSNALYLLNDSASAWLGPVTPGSAASLQNSQCTLNGSASNAAIAGNTMTVNAALVFKPAFAGNKTVFLFGYTAAAGTGYQTAGVWTVPGGAPTAGPLTPASGSGTSQTFSAPFTNPGGADAFTSAYIVINSSWSAPASCYVSYQRSNNAVYLLNDSASAWLGPVTPGSAAFLQNSQCTVNGSGSSVTIAGNTLTLNAFLTFKAAFAGAKTVFLFAYTTTSDTGYQTAGVWFNPAQ